MTETRHRKFAHWIVLALLLSFAIVASPCLADEKNGALEKYKEGMEAIKTENYPVALSAFEESYRLNPKSGMLYNIAMCHKALFQYVDAINTFERYLKDAGSEANPAMRKDAEDAIAELSKMVGTLRIDGAPLGSQVILRGETMGTTPLSKPLLLDPGQYPVRIALKGYESLETKVTIAAEAQSVINADLQPEQAGPEEPAAVQPTQTHESATLPMAAEAGQSSNTTTAKPSVLFWTGLAGTVVSGTLAGVFWGLQSSSVKDYNTNNVAYEAEPTQALRDERDDNASDAEKYNKVAIAMTITASALAVGSIIVLVVDLSGNEESESNISANLSPTGLSISGRF